MVRQWQKIFYNSKFSASELTHDTPDYLKLANLWVQLVKNDGKV